MKSNLTNIIVEGTPYHRELVTNILKSSNNYVVTELNSKTEISNYVIYNIYGKGPWPHKNPKLWLSKKNLLILHWIGTDVLDMTNSYANEKVHVKIYHRLWLSLLRYKYKNNTLVHLAGAPWLVEELETVGIKAKYFPLTSINTENAETLLDDVEKDIDVLSYVPINKFDFYGGSKIIRLAKELPTYKFFLLHPDLDEITCDINQRYPKNVTVSPNVDFKEMKELYLRSKVFLRLTDHDGLSLSVLEALFYKLQVCWTYSFPNTHHVKDYETLKISVMHEVENWVANNQGHEYVKEKFDIKRWKVQFKQMIEETISENYK